jgi:sugar transferase (PEP-CTERM/EpsH1 system associated)
MRLLYLAQRVPYPPDRGDKIATYHHIHHLSRNHEVAVACLADGAEDLENVSALSSIVSSIDVAPVSRRRARLRTLAALAGATPLTLAYFNEPELHRRLEQRLRTQRFDAVLVFSSGMAQFAERMDNVARIMLFSDLDSLKWDQCAERSSPPMRWVYAVEARRLRRYERRVAAMFDHSVVCSEPELHDCRRLMPEARVSCVSNGVDLDYFSPTAAPRAKNSLVFTGVMDYLPNVDGVTWFCNEVFPLVRARIPDATFTICGSRPTRAVRALGRLPSVTVTGRVPDVRPYLDRAAVCVVPLRIARGIQNKLLEAMAAGLPCVATNIAFDGIEATRETDLRTADAPPDFAARVVELLENDDLRAALGRSARAAMERNYSWDTRLVGLEKIIEHVVSPSEPTPLPKLVTCSDL